MSCSTRARTPSASAPDRPYCIRSCLERPLTGRTAGLLVGIVADRPGRDLVRARSMLSSDLDAAEEVLQGFREPLKIQLCGPWTLAAALELPHSMNVALADPGAIADLAASLAEVAAAHAAEVAERVPGARLVVQFDEPALPGGRGGAVPTASSLSWLAQVEVDVLQERLTEVLAAAGGQCTVVHCCATAVPFGIIKAAGAGGVAFDLGRLRRQDEDGSPSLCSSRCHQRKRESVKRLGRAF